MKMDYWRRSAEMLRTKRRTNREGRELIQVKGNEYLRYLDSTAKAKSNLYGNAIFYKSWPKENWRWSSEGRSQRGRILVNSTRAPTTTGGDDVNIFTIADFRKILFAAFHRYGIWPIPKLHKLCVFSCFRVDEIVAVVDF